MGLPSVGANPRRLENLQIGGGYGSSPDGGADLDNAGNLAIDGDATVGGVLSLAPGGLDKTWTHSMNPSAAVLSSANSPGGPTLVHNGDFKGNFETLDFDPTTREFAYWQVALPEGYDGSALKVRIFWTATGGTIGQSVVWRLSLGAYADNEDPQTSTAGGLSAADALQNVNFIHSTTINNVTPALASTGGLLVVHIQRDAAHVNDTLTVDANLISMELSYE